MDEDHLPSELRDVPASILRRHDEINTLLKWCISSLQNYVNKRIIEFNKTPSFAEALGKPTDDVVKATEDLLREPPWVVEEGDVQALTPKEEPQPPSSSSHNISLVFRHDCQYLSCADDRCLLCAESQTRQCTRNFVSKYLVGDPVRAECGAVIRIEAINSNTGQSLSPEDMVGIRLDAVVINSRALDNFSGVPITDADIEKLQLTTNGRDGPLLTFPNGGTYDSSGKLSLPLKGSEVVLSDLRITASSEALLQGQRPQFAILIRAVDSRTGRRVESIPPLLSEGFVVATQRVKGASKKSIPHVNDHVSKLTSVGKASQIKLLDMHAVSLEAGIRDLPLELRSVTTVGKFRMLIAWAEADLMRSTTLKRVLKLAKGWDEARDHASMAVSDDFNVRLYYSTPSLDKGLVFRCVDGVPEIDDPLATFVRKKLAEGGNSVDTIIIHPRQHTEALVHLVPEVKMARAAWFKPLHPGWGILDSDSDTLMHRLQMEGDVVFSGPVVSNANPFASPMNAKQVDADAIQSRKVVSGVWPCWSSDAVPPRAGSPGEQGRARRRQARVTALRDRHALYPETQNSNKAFEYGNSAFATMKNTGGGTKRPLPTSWQARTDAFPPPPSAPPSNPMSSLGFLPNSQIGGVGIRPSMHVYNGRGFDRHPNSVLNAGKLLGQRSLSGGVQPHSRFDPKDVRDQKGGPLNAILHAFGERREYSKNPIATSGKNLDVKTEALALAQILNELQQATAPSTSAASGSGGVGGVISNTGSLKSREGSFGAGFQPPQSLQMQQSLEDRSNAWYTQQRIEPIASSSNSLDLLNNASIKQLETLLAGLNDPKGNLAMTLSNMLSSPAGSGPAIGQDGDFGMRRNNIKESHVPLWNLASQPRNQDPGSLRAPPPYLPANNERNHMKNGAGDSFQEPNGTIAAKSNEEISNAVWQQLLSELPLFNNTSKGMDRSAKNMSSSSKNDFLDPGAPNLPGGSSRSGHRPMVPAAMTLPSGKSDANDLVRSSVDPRGRLGLLNDVRANNNLGPTARLSNPRQQPFRSKDHSLRSDAEVQQRSASLPLLRSTGGNKTSTEPTFSMSAVAVPRSQSDYPFKRPKTEQDSMFESQGNPA